MVHRFVAIIAIFAVATVKGCSPPLNGPTGSIVSRIQTTTNPNELLASLTVYDKKGAEVSTKAAIMKLDEASISVIPNTDDIAVLEAPTPLADATRGYTVNADDWPNLTLSKTGEMGTTRSIVLLDPMDGSAPLPAGRRGFAYFVSGDLAYIFYESPSTFEFGLRVYAIVDLTNANNAVQYSVVRNANIFLGSGNSAAVYEDINVVTLAGEGSLCVLRVYLSYNPTSVSVIFDSYLLDQIDLLDAVAEGKDVAYGLQQDLRYGVDIVTPGLARVTRTTLATGEREDPISFDLTTVQDVESANMFCFPSHSAVHVRNKGLVRMDDLVIGDLVMVTNNQYESVYSFGHKNQDSAKHNFLEISTTQSTTPLVISPDHMIATPTLGFVPALHLKVGDFVVGGDDKAAQILSVTNMKAQGAFAPFTPSGKLIVNGIVASSFVAVEHASLNVGGIQFSWQWIAHTFEFPHRIACHYFGQSCPDEMYDAAGISRWVSAPHAIGQWVLKQRGIVRNALLSMFVATLFTFAATETLLVYPLVGALSLVALALLYFQGRASIKVKTM